MIATLATRAAADGIDVVVVTGDRDSFQLVSDPHIKVLYNKRGVSDYALYDEAGIAERCGGVTPAQYPEYAALRGDTSDNLPGVPGIGEKTAAKLVTTYGALEGIFEHLDDLPPKQRQNLADAQDRVLKNREMSVLDREVERRRGAQGSRARAVRRGARAHPLQPTRVPHAVARASSTRSARKERRPSAPESEAFEVEGVVARDAAAALAAMKAANAAPRVAAEARWAGVAGRSELAALSVATVAERGHLRRRRVARASRRSVRSSRRSRPAPSPAWWRTGPRSSRTACDVDLRSLAHDTALMAYLLDPGEGKYTLEDLARRYLSVELVSPDRVEGTLDLDGDSGIEESQRRAALLLAARRGARGVAAARASCSICTSAWSARSFACWRAWSTPASASTSGS